RGINKPELVLEISNLADELGVAVPIPTFCANKLELAMAVKIVVVIIFLIAV
ncbi:MAG: hypothetical protein RLZ33_2028, partial [Bacteroidota bacterium]